MKKIKQRFTASWFAFLGIYVFVFLFSLASVMTTADDYAGGNQMAEFGTKLFPVFEFPVFTLLQGTGFLFNSDNNLLIFILLILNLILNCLLMTFILDNIFLRIKLLVVRLFRSRPLN